MVGEGVTEPDRFPPMIHNEIHAACQREMTALTNEVQSLVVKSRLTRWRDIFLVGRIVREEVSRYAEWGTLVDPFTLQRAVSQPDLALIVERCIIRVGEERGLPVEAVEAAADRIANEIAAAQM